MPDQEHAIDVLKTGGVGVLPTDTLYGLVGSALVPETVERIYKLKERNSHKPLIVLIAEISELEQFGIELSEKLIGELGHYWPHGGAAEAEASWSKERQPRSAGLNQAFFAGAESATTDSERGSLAAELRGIATSKPEPYSIVLPTIDDQFEYLSRNTDTIAFRVPDKEDLRDLLRATGPLVAPSANIEGKPPAQTIEQARTYFGTDVDFYLDGGELAGKSSTILLLDGDEIRVVRA